MTKIIFIDEIKLKEQKLMIIIIWRILRVVRIITTMIIMTIKIIIYYNKNENDIM